MPQQVRARTQQQVKFSANSKVSQDLSRGMIYRQLHLNLTAQPTVSAANNSAANTGRGDLWSLIKRIDIIANGTETIKSISGPTLRMLQYFWYGRLPENSGVATLGDGSTANPSLSQTIILPFWMPNSLRPMDTALASANLSSLTINVTWGNYSDLSFAATGWTTEPVLNVESIESFGIKGPFSQWRLWEIEKTITASSQNLQIDLPVGSLFNGFLFNATDADADSDAIINAIKLKSGSTVFADQKFGVMRDAMNLMANRVESAGAVSTLYKKTAWGNYNHTLDGYLSESIDTLGFSELQLEMDVTVGGGTTNLYVVPSQIIPVRGGAHGHG